MHKSKQLNVRISREDQLYLASLSKKSTSEALRYLIATGRKKELSELQGEDPIQPLIKEIGELKRQLVEFQMSVESSQQLAISETLKRFFRTISPAARDAVRRDGATKID